MHRHTDTAALDRLRTRIQALRAKTTVNGCTEAEALLAAAKVAELLDRYDLSVPVLAPAGKFNNPDLQKLYDELTVSGSRSLADALMVGAAIEEIDILDLKERVAQTDQEDIRQVFESLLYGSYNHLNAFSSVYAQQTGAAYTPQYMIEADYAEYQQYLADNGLFNGAGGRGRGNGGGGNGGGGGGGKR